jgi:nucleoid DNA-binding protein
MSVSIKNFYDNYNLEFKTGNFSIDKTKYRLILKLMFKLIIKDLFSGDFIKIPFGLGQFKILKYKQTKLALDFKNTALLGRKVYHQNFHSGGYGYKFKWDKKDCKNFRGKKLYEFKLNRAISRELARGIKQNKLEFLSE